MCAAVCGKGTGRRESLRAGGARESTTVYGQVALQAAGSDKFATALTTPKSPTPLPVRH